MDELNIIADENSDSNGRASCAHGNNAILEFINPMPVCWICFLDNRIDKAKNNTQWDENFIHCFSKTKQGLGKQVVFDWFEYKGYHIGNGIYQDSNMMDFYKHHPNVGDPNPDATKPTLNDCSAKPVVWKPVWKILENLQ
jgi:hypothetical protein